MCSSENSGLSTMARGLGLMVLCFLPSLASAQVTTGLPRVAVPGAPGEAVPDSRPAGSTSGGIGSGRGPSAVTRVGG